MHHRGTGRHGGNVELLQASAKGLQLGSIGGIRQKHCLPNREAGGHRLKDEMNAVQKQEVGCLATGDGAEAGNDRVMTAGDAPHYSMLAGPHPQRRWLKALARSRCAARRLAMLARAAGACEA